MPQLQDRTTPTAERIRGWQHWSPYAALAWSLIYTALAAWWLAGGQGFPYPPEAAADIMRPIIGRFGPATSWTAVLLAGLPAAALAMAMLRNLRGPALRPILIAAGALLAAALLLVMTSLDLLVRLGYIPFALVSLVTGAKFGRDFFASFVQWPTLHQLLCLAGGFAWLGATVCYARRSANACLRCGRRDRPDHSPDRAARLGRIAVAVAFLAPLFYAFTRYAWALGWPLGMSEQALRRGQASGTWISGLFLANFALVGSLLMLGLIQRWGEVFPRWLPGLSKRRVPIPLAVIPAALVSVLLTVGGISIWSSLPGMIEKMKALGPEKVGTVSGAVLYGLGPTLLFPLWGAALAVAALSYYHRRRGPCPHCHRGTT